MPSPCIDQGQAQDEDRNVCSEFSAKHIAICRLSDAISVTVLAMMMVGSMSKGDGGGFSIFVFDGRCSVSNEWRRHRRKLRNSNLEQNVAKGC